MESPTRTLRLTRCPDPACGAPAEVTGEVWVPSTAGAVEMVRIFCVRRHVYVLPSRPGMP